MIQYYLIIVLSPYDGAEDGLTVLGTNARNARLIIATLYLTQMVSRILASADSLSKNFEWLVENMKQERLEEIGWPSKSVLIQTFWNTVRYTIDTDQISSRENLIKSRCTFKVLVGDGTNCGCLLPTKEHHTCQPRQQKQGNIYIVYVRHISAHPMQK
jgi:hypothetical protein